MPLILRRSEIRIQAEKAWLDALLAFAPDVRGLIVCAVPHVARLREARDINLCKVLETAGFATLLLSLLTPHEDMRDPDLKYDIALLCQRLAAVCNWIDHQPVMDELPLGIIASDTAAASAIRLAQQSESRVAALVSKAGRVDLAGAAPLRSLQVPLLMLIPGAEPQLQAPSRQAFALLDGPREFVEIPQASTSFMEPGTLDTAAQLSCRWLLSHLPQTIVTQAASPLPPAENGLS